jgi:hypothetical protein
VGRRRKEQEEEKRKQILNFRNKNIKILFIQVSFQVFMNLGIYKNKNGNLPVKRECHPLHGPKIKNG